MKKILALVLAIVLAACVSAALADEEVKVLTHEEYIAYTAPEGDEEVAPITVETYVQAHQSWWDNKVSVYAQSEDGAYFLYNMACSEEDAAKLVPGTKIRVTGFKSEWEGEVELTEATFEFVDGDPFIAEAEDHTELLGKEELADHMNEFVSFKGLTVAPSKIADSDEEFAFLYGWDGSGSREDNGGVGADLYFNVELDGNVFNFCVESYLCGADTDVYKAVEGLKVGDKIDVEGFLYWYQGANPHITSVKPAE